MKIRQAEADDAPAIHDCAQRAYARYVPLIGRKPAPMTADFASQIAERKVHVAVDSHGALEGFIVFYAEDDHVLLENVAVNPDVAGRGVGKALIAQCEDAARRLGSARVLLYTNEKMTDNLSIYRRLGYVEVARRSESGFRRVYFQKRLG